ncbi:MAG: sensor histidine kinase [Puniceicoccaceae bacterium]
MDNSISLKRFHRVIFILGFFTLMIYAVAILSVMLFFHSVVSRQILDRDGSLLTSVSQHFYNNLVFYGEDPDLFEVALEASEISGVIGVRLYSINGELTEQIPTTLYPAKLSNNDFDLLQEGEFITRLFPELPMDTLFSDAAVTSRGGQYPVTEVITPIKTSDNELVAIIQYWLDGDEVSQEQNELTANLRTMGIVFLLSGAFIFALVFFYARHRLLMMGRVLAERNLSLEKANTDLAMAARTSAIGSVTSHLFHGLKNPLAGLKTYLSVTQGDEEVVAIADRMQSLIDETLSVIQQQEDSLAPDLSMTEFKELALSRLNGDPNRVFQISLPDEHQVSSRKAQLILMILRNLIDNAAEASPDGSPVTVRMLVVNGAFCVEIEDQGPGLPEIIKKNLFKPVKSSKEHGTGIGLAISAVIASHIPADLKLVRSDEKGTHFSIKMPL